MTRKYAKRGSYRTIRRGIAFPEPLLSELQTSAAHLGRTVNSIVIERCSCVQSPRNAGKSHSRRGKRTWMAEKRVHKCARGNGPGQHDWDHWEMLCYRIGIWENEFLHQTTTRTNTQSRQQCQASPGRRRRNQNWQSKDDWKAMDLDIDWTRDEIVQW